jgi:hypothetical protein
MYGVVKNMYNYYYVTHKYHPDLFTGQWQFQGGQQQALFKAVIAAVSCSGTEILCIFYFALLVLENYFECSKYADEI